MTTRFLTLLALSLFFGCGDEAVSDAPAEETVPDVESDLVAPTTGGKSDTGYLSNLAVELEGVFESSLRIDVSDLDEEARQAQADDLLAGGPVVQAVLDPQIKFAKNQINTSALHLNLSSSDAEVQTATVEGDFIQVTYQSTVETIISHDDLVEAGLTLEQVKAETYSALLPDLPEAMADKVGLACLTEDQTEVHGYNYFYYFDPDREGCTEAMQAADINMAAARLSIRDLAPAKTVYPEYDLLTADKKVDVVAFFGAADYGWTEGEWDWGTYQRDQFRSALTARGFEEADVERGQLFVRKVGELTENVRIVGPETLKSLKDDEEGLFKQLVRDNEIVMYNGHSFYGSLDVLEEADLYPGRYQIFFMNSCWSYEYYTKQIFGQNVTEEDPEGWLLADVVNDTESGWFHNMGAESRILLSNLLRGAETGGKEGDRYYTWDRIIGAMNDHAIKIQGQRGTETHEIYGVSGVRTNRYEP